MLQLRGGKSKKKKKKKSVLHQCSNLNLSLKNNQKSLRFTLKTLEDSKIKIQIKCV